MRNRSLFLVAIALGFFALAFLGRGRGDAESLYRGIERSGLLCRPPIGEIDSHLKFLLHATRFEGHWSVNSGPTASQLTIVYFCPGGHEDAVPPRAAGLVRNCAYVGEPSLIICDGEFFSTFVVTSGIVAELGSFPSKKEQIRRAERAVHIWVIGHEIGHVLNNHRPAHFTAEHIESIVASSSVAHRIEIEADEWFVRQLKLEAERRVEVEVTLLSLLYAQVRAKVGSDRLFPGTGVPLTNVWIEYARGRSHPEFVVRATRMLSLSFAGEGGASGMKTQIDSFARGLREAE